MANDTLLGLAGPSGKTHTHPVVVQLRRKKGDPDPRTRCFFNRHTHRSNNEKRFLFSLFAFFNPLNFKLWDLWAGPHLHSSFLELDTLPFTFIREYYGFSERLFSSLHREKHFPFQSSATEVACDKWPAAVKHKGTGIRRYPNMVLM